VEVCPSSVNKATAGRVILKDLQESKECDFILCMGDGKTDEPLFALLNDKEYAMTVTVGKKQTEAKYYIETVEAVKQVILDICD
jgi:trehalose 6-phosphate synthase/phosphatase